jgi:collagenase-like PrtC family protease
MRYLHGRNVRGYVAFNTLIFTDELEDAVRPSARWRRRASTR